MACPSANVHFLTTGALSTMFFLPYVFLSDSSARRRPTSCLFFGCMSVGLPMSIAVAMPVLGNARASACAWRSAAQSDCGCRSSGLRYPASCTK